MNPLYFCKLFISSSGLCNQLYSLIAGILQAIEEKKNVVVIDSFMNEIQKNKYSPISFILDLPKMNEYLQKRFNLVLVDSSFLQFEILDIQYGGEKEESRLKIKEPIMSQFSKNSLLLNIPKNYDFSMWNSLISPHIIEKKIYIRFQIGDYVIEANYPEKREEDIIFDLQQPLYKLLGIWRTKHNEPVFNEILQNILFAPNLYPYALQCVNTVKEKYSSDTIHVIHLRIEDDAIEHWSKQNNLSPQEYKEKVENKYITMIQKHIPNKNVPIILLTYSFQNRVIQYLQTNQYNIVINNKDKEIGREVNAIVDLIIGEQCNGVYMGPYTSTFTQTLYYRMNMVKKSHYFNLDKIELDDFSFPYPKMNML